MQEGPDVDAQRPDFSTLVASVARQLSAEDGVPLTLQRAVDLAAQHLDGQVYASVSLVRARRHVDTPASSDERATRADHLQYELAQGPCLDAIWEQDTFAIDDMTTEDRYPQWSRRVHEDTGIRSSLSLQLFTTATSLGALNLYSPHPAAFDDQGRAEALIFAAHAAIALQRAQTEEHLRSALLTRLVIGQAEGILMERFGLDATRAFETLQRVSQHSNVKLRDVAQRLVETRHTPA
jgi:GAF domain-containing protein